MKTVIAVILCVAVGFVEPHGFLKEPVARTSIQTRTEFNTQQPYWWDNSGVWCNNVQQNEQFSSCGRCGEAQGNRDASQNGMYDKKVIVANYTSGSQVEMTAQIDAAHGGGMIFELCASETESDSCFQRLNIVSSNRPIQNNRACLPNGSAVATARVQLPAGVRCNRCTIRWTYRTSYPPNPECHNPQPAQTFRNCADVRIN